MQQTQVPQLEETRSAILKAKGDAWLAKQEKAFDQQYGGAVKDPAFKMWLIAKNNGIEVAEIKVSGGSDEGEQIVIAEMTPDLIEEEIAKDQKEQKKFSVTGVLLALEHGVSSKGKPKIDFQITDGTGIAKGAAFGNAVDLFAEAKVRVGDVIKLPLANVWGGHHNFGKEPNMLWWKFTVPPFGQVIALDKDPKEYFRNVEEDAVKEKHPVFIAGFITHIEERTNEVCSVCTRWITEKDTHEKCQEDESFQAENETTWNATATSFNGQTCKLFIPESVGKPAVKVCVDAVEVFGQFNKSGGINVFLVRKLGPNGAEPVAVQKPKVAAAPPKPAAKAVVAAAKVAPAKVAPAKVAPAKLAAKPVVAVKAKAAPPPPPIESDAEEAQDTEEAPIEEEEEAPAPPPKPAPRPIAKAPAKKVAPPPPPAEEEEPSPEENVEEIEEAVEEPEPAPVVVKAATKTATAAKAPAAPAKPAPAAKAPPAPAKPALKPKAAPAADGEMPAEIAAHIQKSCKQFGGVNRVFVIARTAMQTSRKDTDALFGALGHLDPEAAKTQMEAYIAQAAEQGLVSYTNEAKNTVKWE